MISCYWTVSPTTAPPSKKRREMFPRSNPGDQTYAKVTVLGIVPGSVHIADLKN